MVAGARVADSRNDGLQSAAWLVAAVLLPNVVLLACGQFLFLQRAWINIDYVLVALAGLILWQRPIWLVLLAASVFMVDMLFSFAPAYHFTPSSLVDSARGVFNLGIGFVFLNAAVLIAAASLVAWGMAATIGRVSRPLPAIVAGLVLGVVIGVLDPLVSKSVVRLGDRALTIPNLGFSTSLNAAIALRSSTRSDARAPSAFDVESAGDEIRSLIDGTTEDRPSLLILVNVESLGLLQSPALNDYQMAPLMALADHPDWHVSVGQVPFEGSTVAGELRELCDIRYLTVSPDMNEKLSAACLPKQLDGLGYQTAAFHGFQGTFFERNRWYHELGFDEIYFGTRMWARFDDLARCGSAFEGICDRSAWRAIVQYARQAPRPAFIYWMTLTAHLPVLEHQQRPDFESCPAASARHPKICSHLAWHRTLFDALARDLRRGALDGARLILVGDHSPPFLNENRRALFSQTHVPLVDIRYAGPQSLGTAR